MKNFIKTWISLINKRDFVTSITVGLVMLGMVACGGTMGMIPGVPGLPSLTKVVHLITIPNSGHRLMPSTASDKPFVAAMFQATPAPTPTPSQVAQSYDLTCTLADGFTPPNSGLMPVPGLDSQTTGPNICNLVEPTDQLPEPQTDAAGGKQTYFNGTLTTLIVTGKTISGAKFQCRDITNTLGVLDNSYTMPYVDLAAHQLKVFNQVQDGAVTQVPFVCNGIGSDTDQVASIDVQFSKI